MTHLPQLILDLAVILGVAAIVTFLFRIIKQPVVLGYIAAGIIVGPYTPPIFSVVDKGSVAIWAELGVIFLMFALGLEFSFRRLAKVGISATATAILQIVTMVILGFVCAKALGWSSMNAIFLGCMISISSTTIIIKALEELGLKSKKFSELVFGILIVEDLAAIIMLVALSNMITQESASGVGLLISAAKLGLVVGAWLIFGMFVVPRFVNAVGERGNDEMMLVVSIGLCLGLVAVSARFGYSVALGAFIMGSILAETNKAQHIEHLIAPLKDLFGAVFFVSVGMMLDPSIIVSHFGSVMLICMVIITGKILSVSIGALGTGQSLTTSVYSGLSMAQIGEFSFIIATLGLSYKAIDEILYPIIVSASLITTFTTPYLIKLAPTLTKFIEDKSSKRILSLLDHYQMWFQRRSLVRSSDPNTAKRLIRWGANAIVVITLFLSSGDRLIPILRPMIGDEVWTRSLCWLGTFLVASPFILAMFTTYGPNVRRVDIAVRRKRFAIVDPSFLISRLATIFLIGFVSVEFFAPWLTLALTISASVLIFVVFRRHVEGYYTWFESEFVSGLSNPQMADTKALGTHQHLAPWDIQLAEIEVGSSSVMTGQSLAELHLRETFGINVVVIMRSHENIVAPRASERIYPMDKLLCFGTDEEIDQFRAEIEKSKDVPQKVQAGFELRRILIDAKTSYAGNSILNSGIGKVYNCIVVGLERSGERIRSPRSELEIMVGDILWIVGDQKNLLKLQRS